MRGGGGGAPVSHGGGGLADLVQNDCLVNDLTR